MCLSGAVLKQNSKSIQQLVHPSLWLSPGKIYWMQLQPWHAGTSSFLHGWLDTESQNSTDLLAQVCQVIGRNSVDCSQCKYQRALTFRTNLTAVLQLRNFCHRTSSQPMLSCSSLVLISFSLHSPKIEKNQPGKIPKLGGRTVIAINNLRCFSSSLVQHVPFQMSPFWMLDFYSTQNLEKNTEAEKQLWRNVRGITRSRCDHSEVLFANLAFCI